MSRKGIARIPVVGGVAYALGEMVYHITKMVVSAVVGFLLLVVCFAYVLWGYPALTRFAEWLGTL